MASTSPRAQSRGGTSGRRRPPRFRPETLRPRSRGGKSGDEGLASPPVARRSLGLAQEFENVGELPRSPHRWQRLQDPPAVRLVPETPVANHQHAPIRLGPDQAAGALLEADRGLRQLVVEEGIAALALDLRQA